MSMPEFPSLGGLSKDVAINLIIASIAFEELGLAHILNAEGEKIQHVADLTDETITIGDLTLINESVGKTLRNLIKKQMLLQFKLEDIINELT